MPVRQGSKRENMYSDHERSSPDHSYHHRSSSNDSLDGSYHGHSRQSSGSGEYPTRPQRRSSAAASDPLQFIKQQRQNELARQAEEQMKIAAERKLLEKKPSQDLSDFMSTKKTDDDWQSNLSSWKTRRKSQSHQAYQLKEELEAEEREAEELKRETLTKTFSQMVDERDRRKSTSTRSFYPVEDEFDNKDEIPFLAETRDDAVVTMSSIEPEVEVWAEGGHDTEEDSNNNQMADKKNDLSSDDPFEAEIVDISHNTDRSPKRRYGGNTEFNTNYRTAEETVIKQNTRNNLESGSKGVNKISDIRNRFERPKEDEVDSRSKSTVVTTKVDLRSRMKSFERDNSVEEIVKPDTSVNSRRPGRTVLPSSPPEYAEAEASTRRTSKRSERTVPPATSSGYVEVESSRNSTYSARTRPVRAVSPVSPSGYAEAESSRNSARNRPVRAVHPSSPPGYLERERNNTYGSLRKSGRDYTEKTIKISQKQNNERGFGFTVCGGCDTDEVPSVRKVRLGSAADVCDVQSKDEILAINRADISNKTNQQINQLVQDAVTTGQLELRIKRFLGNNAEEEEFFSSDEEVESLEQRSRSNHLLDDSDKGVNMSSDSRDSTIQEDFRAAVNNNPVASVLDDGELTAGEERYREQPQVNEHSPEAANSSSSPAVLNQTPESAYRQESVEVEMRPTLTVQRRDKTVDVENKYRKDIPRGIDRTTRSHSAGGPPDILKKWQRQRPPSEYTFDREPSPDKRLASSLPWMDTNAISSTDRDDYSPLEKASHDFASSQPDPPVPSPRRRFGDQKRQEEWNEREEQLRKIEDDQTQGQVEQERFSEGQDRIQTEYNTDIQRASEIARQHAQQEQQMLEPEMERMRITEERRKERRLRHQQLMESKQQPDNNSVNPNYITEEVLMIDPRNRGETLPEYNFQININTREMSEVQAGESREERRQKEERRRVGEDDRREEENRRYEEKAARLREQEDQLRQQEDRLRREQDKFHREQEELERLKNSANYNNTNATMFQAPVSRVREPSPSYQSVVTKRPGVIKGSAAQQYSTTMVVEPNNQYSVKSIAPSWQPNEPRRSASDIGDRSRFSREDMLAMNRKATPLHSRPDLTPPTSPTDGSGPIIKRITPNREQLHSLNAVPKQRFRSSHDWIGSDQNLHESSSSHGPSKHSEVMRKQFSTPQEHWLFEEAERRRKISKAEPTSYSRQTPTHSQFSGPIKPASDNHWRDEPLSNRQQTTVLNSSFEKNEGTMPAAIRQTVLLKTAGARGSTGSNYSQDFSSTSYGSQYPGTASLSNTMPSNYNYNGSPTSRPTEHSAPPPPEPKLEAPVSVSGRQQCSHCGQELGYGAAMIIESLGLSYHVQCFKCCVCHTPLGNGTEGADVRVRVNKLHCPNCYSNDEAGLKFSKV